MKIEFKQDELISKNGKSYPVVGGRLRVAHEDNESLSIITDMVRFEAMSQAAVKATIKTSKGEYSAYGVASAQKDERLIDSLLELAETRAIARSLRFAGYGVEYTGLEEVPESTVTRDNWQAQANRLSSRKNTPIREIHQTSATRPQIHAIEKISTLKGWNALECCRRILRASEISSLDELSKDQASEIIGRMKEAA